MKTKDSRWIVTIGLLVAGCTLAACGGDDDGASDAGGTPEASADVTPRDSSPDASNDAPRADTGSDAGAAMDAATSDGDGNDGATIDAGLDVRADRSDTTPDAGPDVAADQSADASEEDSGDAAVDAPPEGGADDASVDGATDGPKVDGGDGSGPTVDQDCRDCMIAKLMANGSPDGCDALVGNAAAGPAAGTPLKQLCRETLDCFHRTNCHENAVFECYCGTAIDQGTCYTAMTIPTPGSCKTELDRSLEIAAGAAGSVALDRIVDPMFAGGVAGIAGAFEDSPPPDGCLNVCIPYTPTH